MGILQRITTGLTLLTLALASVDCANVDTGSDSEVSISNTLTVPYSAVDLGAGSVKYSVTLPSGQKYVEVFARKNGVQNVAHKIVTSGVVNGNGTTTYSYVKTGYLVGDNVEYRFYSYIGPAVFTPGPAQSQWVSFTYGAATFKTSTGNYLLGTQQDASGRPFRYEIATSTGSTYITPFSTGWILSKASPQSTQVDSDAEADLVGTFVKRAGSDVYDPAPTYSNGFTVTATHYGSVLDVTVDPDTSFYPGQKVDTFYAEGGHLVTIPTFIGPQTLLTDATVSFAYLIKQKTWTGQ